MAKRVEPGRRRKSEAWKNFVLEQLEEFGEVRAQAMFGGWGLYRGERFFGILFDGRLYFRTDDATRPGYEARGMRAFVPPRGRSLRRYFEVPADVLEDPAELRQWAAAAVDAARAGGA